MKEIRYERIKSRGAKLRLYLNDPIVSSAVGLGEEAPIPIEIGGGECVLAKTEDGKQHIFFVHALRSKAKGFIPVFIDLEEKW